MAERRKIALRYKYNENWIGGTYYIQNLISALRQLPDEQRPFLHIISDNPDQFEKLKQLTGYPYISFQRARRDLNFVQRGINKLSRIVLKKNSFSTTQKQQKVDLVFPGGDESIFESTQVFLYWVPDFQEHYLTSFFSGSEIASRKQVQKSIVEKGKYIVLSSRDAQKDLNKFYPDNRLQQFVLPFAVTHPASNIDKETVIARYKLPTKFFICSNQFWKHKNHEVVLKAVAALKEAGEPVFVAFTGQENDPRNPGYFQDLRKIAADSAITDHIAFLGFISREDQLTLMKHALAIIQPSLFEGWSTVIEDGKALGVPIIAADLAVNKEQLEQYPCKSFFSPLEANELASCMQRRTETTGPLAIDYDYKKDILTYGTTFMDIVEMISRHATGKPGTMHRPVNTIER